MPSEPTPPSRARGFFAGLGQSLAHAGRTLVERLIPRRGQPESPDVATGHVLLLLAGWAGFMALSLAGFGWYTAARVKLSSPSQDVHVLPAPRLQVDPAADYDRLTDMQAKRLSSYAWADRTQGRVQIPVERAMEILVGQGAGAFAPLAAAAPDDARSRAVRAATGLKEGVR
ncbi:hypothetical protein [Aureimonas psammosilenae]|uniref:hypothetical protein n=1 Tax=Aureimonas psammosilenae TaxID=2495496 RepID=UPI001260EB33|nr:hypothetical protein [Aureimonas psammosilenae]